MIKENTVEEIKSAARVEDVIEDYVNLKRRGVNMIGLCPFHNEKTPSFTVSPTKNLYKCFGCGKGGDSVRFLMDHDQLTYPEALRQLAGKYGIKIEEEVLSDEVRQAQKEKESLLLINEYAKGYFRHALLNTDEGRSIGLSYFKHRNLLEATIDQFGLGYAPRGGKTFVDAATAEGYSLEKLQLLGLASQSGYDFYRDRVIFPFHNLSGKVIGFGARILTDNPKAPKYLNSPESKLYNKRQTLYGLYQARSEIRKKGACILVEGYTDVLSLSQNGIKNVVASSGTSLTNEQVRLIKRFADAAIVLYDGDAAGQKAALRGLEIFLENDVDVKIAMLPEGADPDSYMQEVGASAFESYIQAEAKDFLLHLAHSIETDHANDPVNKSIEIRSLVTSLSKIYAQLKRDLYVKECARILQIDEGPLHAEINKAIKKRLAKKRRQNPKHRDSAINDLKVEMPAERGHSAVQEPTITRDPTIYQERDIVRILLVSGDKLYDIEDEITVAQYVVENLNGIEIKNETYRTIVDMYISALSAGKMPTREDFLGHQNETIAKVAVDMLFEPYTYANWSDRGVELQTQKPYEENYIKDSYQAILRFKIRAVNERIVQLQQVLMDDDGSNAEVIMTAYQSLMAERKVLAEEMRLIVI